jgi:hypothetical protein
VGPQPQVPGDHRGVAGVGLGAGEHLTVPPGPDRVRVRRHDRVPGLQQRIDQAPVGAFDADRHIGPVLAEPAETAQQVSEAVRGMHDRELACDLAIRVEHAHRVRLGGPVDADAERGFGQEHGISSRWQRRLGEEADHRAVMTGALRRVPLLPVGSPARTGGGGVMRALNGRPNKAITRLSPSPNNEHLASARKECGPVTSQVYEPAMAALSASRR